MCTWVEEVSSRGTSDEAVQILVIGLVWPERLRALKTRDHLPYGNGNVSTIAYRLSQLPMWFMLVAPSPKPGGPKAALNFASYQAEIVAPSPGIDNSTSAVHMMGFTGVFDIYHDTELPHPVPGIGGDI